MLFFIRGIAKLNPPRQTGCHCVSKPSFLEPVESEHRSALGLRMHDSICLANSGGWNSSLMTSAACCWPFFSSSVAADAAVVKRPLGHHLIEVPILRIPRVAVLSMMTDVALVQLRDASLTHGMMASYASGAFLRLMWRIVVGAYERLVPLMIVEDHAASSLFVKPDDFWRESAVRLLRLSRVRE
jgi:hypothetical protein